MIMTSTVINSDAARCGSVGNNGSAEITYESCIQQIVAHVVVQRGACQGSLENTIGLYFGNFVSSKLKIALNAGEIVTKALSVVGHSGHRVIGVYVVGIDSTGH